ncbi:MAG: serine hydrolase [Clostridiales Family XIII bacterium]|jgi:CubicO group peptidase (beta-lactamase class C family)|nr:serine hydrolase [Clostridiales Family XIII bacterium]
MKTNFLEGLDANIEEAMQKMNVTGSSVVIVKDGKTIYQKSFGYADVRKKQPLSVSHYLPIGSASKAFTATAVVMLAADGLIDLDKPIKEYIPEFELNDSFASREATPRDLLCHRTGMPRHEPMWMNWENLDREDLVKNRMKHLFPNAPFRSIWQYQNHMFAVLGYLVEVVSGKTWENFLEKRIFAPLGMKEYSFCYPDSDPELRYAKLYTPDEKGKNKENKAMRFDAMGPAGSIILTPDGLAKWLNFNLSSGKVGKKQLIAPEVFAELHKPNIAYELLPWSFEERFPVGYGLGWFVDSFRGKKIVEHGGNVNGGTSQVSFIPSENFGCAILSNADSSMFPDALSSAILDRYLGFGTEKDWFTAYDSNYKALIVEMKDQTTAILKTKVADKPFAHTLKEYAGTYTHPGYGDLTVKVKKGGLHLLYHEDGGYDIDHLHFETFTMNFIEQIILPITFITNPEGKVSSVEIPFELSTPDKPIRFEKK